MHFRRFTQYLIQYSVVLQNKKYIMSRRPPRRGRCSQATKRGQAGSVSTVNSAGHGHGASFACGPGARLPFFAAAGRVIEPQHAEELVDVAYMLLEDVQRFQGSDDGTQVEEGSNVSLERGVATEGQETRSHVPPAAAYCLVQQHFLKEE
ncbi:hypothetical protein AB205_0181620, partial [Aquarana catesbeiana]